MGGDGDDVLGDGVPDRDQHHADRHQCDAGERAGACGLVQADFSKHMLSLQPVRRYGQAVKRINAPEPAHVILRKTQGSSFQILV
ncbi:hypothetical protein N8071_00520, partial [bacterium]|nr:hypothetical protein [bacterium]